MFKNRILVTLVLQFALIATACDPGGAEKKTQKAPAPATVTTMTLSSEPLLETRTFFGEVRAASDASLSPAESGRVKAVHFVEGDKVKKGQVLIELDDQMARAELNQALAEKKQTTSQKQQAELEVERYEAMRKEQIVSELEASRKSSEAQSLDAAAESNAARVARGAELLRRHRIVAPFDGTVTTRRVDPGDWLNAGDIALELLTAEHVEVDVRVPARMLDALDDVAEVWVGHDEQRIKSRIDSVVNALDPKTRTALLRVTPEESASFLRAGASVQAGFLVERKDGVTVPRDAIVYGVAGARVYVVADNVATPVEVEIVAAAKEKVLVRAEGLQPGAVIVIKGNERLRPGQTVSSQGALVPPTKKAEQKGAQAENKPL